MKGRRNKVLFIVGFIVVAFILGSVSIKLSLKDCPLRTYVPADGFPEKEGLVSLKKAVATSQWARKYDVNCQTCHTAFPRLSFFGEQFKRNGYQMPGTEDGDENKTEVNEHLFIDKLQNLFGLRINITPARFQMNTLTTNGVRKNNLSFGNPNWLQLFTAGSIFKNTSIFIETEIDSNGTSVAHNNWMVLGFENIFKTSLFNVRVGKLSPMENVSQSGRLRMIPSVRIEAISGIVSGGGYSAAAEAAALAGQGVTTANSTHDDAVPLANASPSIEVYGYKGPVLYSVGVTNGRGLTDSNKYKNFFGTLRLDLEDGPLAGSNISGWGYLGWDTANNARARQVDRFWRTTGSANLRWKDLDVVALFVYGRDDNWNLLPTKTRQNSKGISGQVGYLISPMLFTALQYDWVDGTDGSDNFNRLSPCFTVMLRENMRIDLIGRIDLRNTPTTGRQHEVAVNIRSMF